MDDMQELVLTVSNYSQQDDGTYLKTRITIAPHMIQFTIASDSIYSVVEDRELRKVNVILTEGNNLEVFISEIDLLCLERAVGTYYVGER